MMKLLIYVKWAIIAVLAIIVVLWLSYFLDALNKSQHHFFVENNYELNFLKWITKVSTRALVLRLMLFDDNFYLEYFPCVSVFVYTLLVILLVVRVTLPQYK